MQGRPLTRARALLVPFLCGVVYAAAVHPGLAEESRRRWYLGGSVAYQEMTQEFRSNAGIVESRARGDDGIPGTGDPNELNNCSLTPAFNQTVFCDPRPDDQVGREYGIGNPWKVELTAGVMLSRYFSLQIDASRVTETVDPVDLYMHEAYPTLDRLGFPRTALVDAESTTQYQVGDLRQTAVGLTGIVRLRPTSTLRPYFGAGFGRVSVDLDTSDEVDQLNALLASKRIRAIGNEWGIDITGPQDNANNQSAGRVPFVNPLTVTADDALEWHLTGGLEYVINDRLSLSFDARYTFVDREIVLDFSGQDQIDLLVWPKEMFRPDGSLMFYFEGQHPLHPWCSDSGYYAYGCWNVNKLTTRVDPTGDRPPAPTDPTGPPRHGVSCPAMADFNDDGIVDVCLPSTISSPQGFVGANGIYVAQGGSIGLNSFTMSVGLRVKF